MSLTDIVVMTDLMVMLVVNCLLEDVEVDHKDLDTIALRLWDVGRVFKDALNTPAPDDKQLHLRR
ncbi:hypothetical protein ID866_7750 [Astraeus odoratus]|nr:hypothetical protein ID866_7750 [Astraeus odoratus]